MKTCLVCQKTVAEGAFDTEERDGFYFCDDDCVSGYYDMNDIEFAQAKKELKRLEDNDLE